MRLQQLTAGTTAAILFAAMVSSVAAADENWLHWRGPDANGSASASARPPVQWDKQTGIRWTAELPGTGTSTPVVVGNRIYVTSAVETDRAGESATPQQETSKTVPPAVYYEFVVTCINRQDGKEIWQKVLTEAVPHEGHHPTHTYAAGSPTSDGERLYVSFGSFGIFALTLDGEPLWKRDLGDMKTRYGWGEAVSPTLADGKLIINWDQETGAYVTALDAASGATLWKTDRSDEVTSWNTPLVVDAQGQRLAVLNGTGFAAAYNVENGKQVWKCGGQTVNAIPSPVRYRDTVICMSGYRGAFAAAIPIDAQGDVTGSDTLHWTWQQGTPYVPSPLLSGDRLFFTSGNRDILTCLNAETGEPIASRMRLSGVQSMYASGLAANGHLYFVGRGGTTVVLKDDESLETVAVNALDDTIDASPIAVGDDLLLRSWTKLYCLTSE